MLLWGQSWICTINEDACLKGGRKIPEIFYIFRLLLPFMFLDFLVSKIRQACNIRATRMALDIQHLGHCPAEHISRIAMANTRSKYAHDQDVANKPHQPRTLNFQRGYLENRRQLVVSGRLGFTSGHFSLWRSCRDVVFCHLHRKGLALKQVKSKPDAAL